MTLAPPHALALALFGLGASPAPGASGAAADEPFPYRIALPEGPAARAWAGVGPDTRPAAIDPTAIPADPSAPAFDEPDVWAAWAERVAAARDADVPDAARRAELALLAWSWRRSDDAWAHVARTTGDPAWTATAVARLLPGLPLEHLGPGGLGPGGRPSALPGGVVLRPALPPPADGRDPGAGRLALREARVEGLVVGATTMSMVVRVVAEGVQIDFVHVAGPAARLQLVVPVPDGFETRVEYVDWFRRDTVGEPLEVVVDPEQQDANTVFARMRPAEVRWPTRLPQRLPAALELDGLHLLAGASEHPRRIAGLAHALGRLFDFDVSVHARPDPALGGLWIDLSSDPDGRKLRSVVTLAERGALER